MRPARKFVPKQVKGRLFAGHLFAGHLITGRIQNLLPADGAQSLLVSATWKGDHALV